MQSAFNFILEQCSQNNKPIVLLCHVWVYTCQIIRSYAWTKLQVHRYIIEEWVSLRDITKFCLVYYSNAEFAFYEHEHLSLDRVAVIYSILTFA